MLARDAACGIDCSGWFLIYVSVWDVNWLLHKCVEYSIIKKQVVDSGLAINVIVYMRKISMRFRLVVALLLAVLVMPGALAEIQLDLDTATLDELIAARDAISARIEVLESEMMGKILPPGTYLAGRDILPGVYVLQENEMALLPSFTLNDGETGDTLDFEIINRQIVVELLSGQEMQLVEASAYPIAIAPDVEVSVQTVLGVGGYWVGQQIPTGRYCIYPAENAIFACYSIYDGPIGTQSRMEEFVMVHEETEVSLEEGQYIVISDCEMRLAEEEEDG